MSDLAYGYGFIQLEGEEEIFAPNYVMTDETLEFFFNDIVNAGRGLGRITPSANTGFNRYGNKRYHKDFTISLSATTRPAGSTYRAFSYPDTFYDARQDTYNRRRYAANYGSLGKTTAPMAVGSMSGAGNSSIGNSTYGPPSNNHGFDSGSGGAGGIAVTHIDIPGTRIGNMFAHEPGYDNFFNHPTEGTDIAASQGSIAMTGVYSPQEELANHMVYRVYYTKSGGTGKSKGSPVTGTNGSVTTSSDTFTATGSLTGALVDEYIVIRGSTNNDGIYKITDVTGVPNSVVVDATTINKPFTTEGSMSWENKTGPVGEYFFQKRQYDKDQYASTTALSTGYQSVPLSARSRELQGEAVIGSVPIGIVYDRQSCWWWIHQGDDQTQNQNGYGLLRWKHRCVEGWDPLYADSDIQDMPTGIYSWRSIDIDDQGMLWVCWDNTVAAPDSPDQYKCLARIDPAPGVTPNARYPEVTNSGADLYEAQSSAIDSDKLCSNNPSAVMCDNETGRVWVFHRTGDRLGTDQDDGGISYTDDYGTTWKRLHKIHTITGTSLGSTSASTQIDGTGTAFQSDIIPGDWIRLEKEAIGSLTALAKASLADGDWFRFNDGESGPTTFFFDVSGTYTPGTPPTGETYVEIDINADTTADDVGDTTRTAIDGAASIDITSLGGTGATINLKADNVGDQANIDIDEGLASGTLTPVGMRYGIARSYEVDTVSDDSTLDVTENVPYTLTGMPVKKGAIDSTYLENNIFYRRSLQTNYSNDCGAGCTPQYDTDGYIYWIADDRDKVCKWDESNGKVIIVDDGNMYPTGTPAADIPKWLGISRLNLFPGWTHQHQNSLWVAFRNAGWSRIPQKNFDYLKKQRSVYQYSSGGAGITTVQSDNHGLENGVLIEITATTNYDGFYTISNCTTDTFDIEIAYTSDDATGLWEVLCTRYHWSATTEWPRAVDVAKDEPAETARNCQVLCDNSTGMVYLFTPKHDDYGTPATWGIYPYPSQPTWDNPGGISAEQNSSWGISSAYAYQMFSNMKFDDIGLGAALFPPAGAMSSGSMESHQATLQGGTWMCRGWNGTTWVPMFLNNMAADIDFRAADSGPKLDNIPTVGVGVKRMHETEEILDPDTNVMITFNQAGGATLQQDEFLIDENVIFCCYMGTGKDNITEVTWSVDYFLSPTVYREGTEPINDIINPWTCDGGSDGGYVNSADRQLFPDFRRGPSEFDPRYASTNTDTSYYLQSNDDDMDSPAYPHNMVALRIPDLEEVVAPDGYVNDASDTFYTSGGYVFSSGDVMKSIFIENAATAGNNGQAVITAYLSPTSVTVDKTFSAGDETGVKQLRWKLRDVPAVGYVVQHYDYVKYVWDMTVNMQFELYSSKNHGVSWDGPVKQWKDIGACAAHDDISLYIDEGVYQNAGPFNGVIMTENGNVACYPSVIFDLVGGSSPITEAARRRQYWKIVRDYKGSGSNDCRPASVILYDENWNVMGCPDNNKLSDADDPLFNCGWIRGWQIVVHEGVGTITPQDDGDIDNQTYILQSSSSEFYADSASDGQVTDAGVFTSISIALNPEDVGKIIRIPSAIPKSGDPDFDNQFFTIVTVDSATQATLDKNFTNASTLDWQMLTFGANDYIYFDDNLFLTDRWVPIRSFRPIILDVPAANQIYITSDNFPLNIEGTPVSGLDFYIERNFPDSFYTNAHPSRTGIDFGFQSPESQSLMAATSTGRAGVLMYSDYCEFIQLQGQTTGASTAADTDGDGRVQMVTCPGDLTAVFTLDTGQDYIMLGETGSVNERRVWEIKSMNVIGGPNTEVTVTYDEILPSTSFDFWIMRRRSWMKSRVRNAIIIAEERGIT